MTPKEFHIISWTVVSLIAAVGLILLALSGWKVVAGIMLLILALYLVSQLK